MQSILRMALVLAVTYSGRTQIAKEAPTDADFKWQPPVIQAPIPLPPSTLKEMVTTLRVSKILVVLEETKMADGCSGLRAARSQGARSMDLSCRGWTATREWTGAAEIYKQAESNCRLP